MRVVITGGAGFVGRKLAARFLAEGEAIGPDGARGRLDELVLFDVTEPVPPLAPDKRLKLVTGDITDRATVEALITPATTTVIHLAAVVSGGRRTIGLRRRRLPLQVLVHPRVDGFSRLAAYSVRARSHVPAETI